MSKLNLILEVLWEIAEAPDITDGRALQEMIRSKLARLPETDKPTGTTVTDRTPDTRRKDFNETLEAEPGFGLNLYGPGLGIYGPTFTDPCEGCGDSFGVSVAGDGTWIQVTGSGFYTISHIGPGVDCHGNPATGAAPCTCYYALVNICVDDGGHVSRMSWRDCTILEETHCCDGI